MKYHYLILLVAAALTGCHQNSPERSAFNISADEEINLPATKLVAEEANQSTDPTEADQDVNKKKIIKDGNLGLKVKDLAKAKSAMDALVKEHGGYYANESLNNSDYESSYNLRIRIPANNFEALIAAIESGEGEIQYKNIDARDVTEEFIDLETRLENKRQYLGRYKDLLQQAKSVKDILEIEEGIRTIEEEIESAEGRLKYLSDQVAYSTLHLSITEPKDFKFRPRDRYNFTEQLKESVTRGWYGFVDFLLFMVKWWPFALLILLLVFLRRSWRRRH